MKVKEIFTLIPKGTSVCIENKDGNCSSLNEKEYINSSFLELEVISFYPERYNAIASIGLTIVVKE